MSLKERVQDYINDIKEDIVNTQKQYDRQLELIDIETRKDWREYRLKELANIAGQLDTMKSIVEVFDDILKDYN